MTEKMMRGAALWAGVWVGLAEVAVAQTNAQTVPVKKPQEQGVRRQESRSTLQDPFAMQPYSGDMLLPASESTLPEGIQVVGILSLKGGARIGVLKIPGASDYHFVKKDDLVQVQSKGQRQLYLQVQKIHADSIEIAPYTRPEDVRIYR
jgi:hypothetical protein